MLIEAGKKYEQPDAGMFIGTIIDVVDLGIVQTTYGPKHKIRIVWVLDKNDSEGKPFGVISTYNAKMDERSSLYKDVAKIFDTPAPPVPFDSENLLGRTNRLYLKKTTNAVTGKVYTNVGDILPLALGQSGPQAPQGFIRVKDKPKQQMQGRAVQTSVIQPVSSNEEDIPF